MDEHLARAYVGRCNAAVMATIKRDGRPQLSNVTYFLDDDGTLRASVTRDRAKTQNLLRDPRVSMTCLDLSNWWSYVVVEGRASFVEGLEELRRYYRRVRGEEHPNWAEYDEAMVRDKRVLMVVTPERFYGVTRG